MLRLSFVVEIPIGRSKNSMQVRRWNDSGQSLHIVHFILTRAGISNLWLYWGSGDQSWNIVTRKEEKPICMQRSDKCDAGLQDTLHNGQTHEKWHLVFGTCMGWDLSIKASWSERLWHICIIDKAGTIDVYHPRFTHNAVLHEPGQPANVRYWAATFYGRDKLDTKLPYDVNNKRFLQFQHCRICT